MTVSVYFAGARTVCSNVRIGSLLPLFRKRVRPPRGTIGGQHSLASDGAGGANSDDWRESLALCLYSVIQYHTLEFNVMDRIGAMKLQYEYEYMWFWKTNNTHDTTVHCFWSVNTARVPQENMWFVLMLHPRRKSIYQSWFPNNFSDWMRWITRERSYLNMEKRQDLRKNMIGFGLRICNYISRWCHPSHVTCLVPLKNKLSVDKFAQ